MRAVLPGKPQARPQAVSIACWDEKRLIAYITGNAVVILGGANDILQTIYDDSDIELNAVAVDENSGKIATCAGSRIRVYKPYGQDEGALKWSLQSTFDLEDEQDPATSLSWGADEELLIGSSRLSLYATSDTNDLLWQRKLANPISEAIFSHDASYIASSGKHDRFTKVWRRLSYGSDEVRFDFTYLSHPKSVTGLRWRKPYHPEQAVENVLYTTCADQVLRIWAPTDPHGSQILQLWAQVDLAASIKPGPFIQRKRTPKIYACIVDGRDLTIATERAVQGAGGSPGKQPKALKRLIDVASRSPEVCVILDDHGDMSLWAMENVGCRASKKAKIYNIAHLHGLPTGRSIPSAVTDPYTQVHSYCDRSSGALNILFHHFDGRIELFESKLSYLLDTSERKDRLRLRTAWTGHSGPIRKIIRNISGKTIVSRTTEDECLVWSHVASKGTSLRLQSVIDQNEHIHRVCVLGNGRFVVFLHHSKVTLWDTRLSSSKLLAACEYSLSGTALCLLAIPGSGELDSSIYIATISSLGKGIVWQVQLPQHIEANDRSKEISGVSLREFCRFELNVVGELSGAIPVDPAGSVPVTVGFLDTFARDVALSFTRDGVLTAWTARVDSETKEVDWLPTCSVETSVSEPSLASGNSLRKAALVNSEKSQLTIWDVRGKRLEYTHDLVHQDIVQDLDWTSTPDDQSILAVGFRFRVTLLSQMRYDYLNGGPAWAAIREIDIRDMTTHPIGDSAWLSGGDLVIGSGNQLFLYDKQIRVSQANIQNSRFPPNQDMEWNMFELVTRLNGPLPVFHPQFLSQAILAGKSTLVQQILVTLYKTLKYHTEDQTIDHLLGMPLDLFYNDSPKTTSASNHKLDSTFAQYSQDDDEDTENLTTEIASRLNEYLTKIALPQLSGHEQIQLADIVECMALVETQRRSTDDNAARFMLFFRQHMLRKGRANAVNLSWREISWAFHSNSQDILADVVSNQFNGKMLWEHARECGMFMWILDSAAVKAQFEVIARNEYTKSDMKNPVDCSLYYFALRKKAVVQGLWRMAAWNREQAATVKLLSNNFNDAKWKTAALKNAYALLGKRRFEYAAAFFLLGDALSDAVSVCINQMKDLQLAIAIARVYEGDDGPVLKQLIEDKVLPLASQEGNRWLASWAFWMIHKRDIAVRALISPVHTIVENGEPPGPEAKLFLADDPALIVLYAQLRQKSLQALQGASQVTPKAEWDFVLHSAQLYDRMGCDLLALDLVRNWEFLQPAPAVEVPGSPVDPRKMLKRRSSLVVADLPPPSPGVEKKGKEPPTVFEEPAASSLLDSFGF